MYSLVPVTHRSTLITDFNDWFILSQVPHNTAAAGRCRGQDVLYLSVPWHTTDVIRWESFTSWCQRVAWVCQIPDVNLRITSSWCQQAWFKGVEVQSLDWPYSTKQRNKWQEWTANSRIFCEPTRHRQCLNERSGAHVWKADSRFSPHMPFTQKDYTYGALCSPNRDKKTTVLQSFFRRVLKV